MELTPTIVRTRTLRNQLTPTRALGKRIRNMELANSFTLALVRTMAIGRMAKGMVRES